MTAIAHSLTHRHRAISRNSPPPAGYTGVMYVDGSCPENPGEMGVGAVISFKSGGTAAGGIEIVEYGLRLGEGTNNTAEYLALIYGLREAIRRGCTTLSVKSDSQLIVNQVNGKWECKDSRLRHLHAEAVALMQLVPYCDLSHIPREQNQEADRLSKTPTLPPPMETEINLASPTRHPRRLLRRQAAMVRWWWQKQICQNEYRLSRLFGNSGACMGRIGRGETYTDLTESDLIWYKE